MIPHTVASIVIFEFVVLKTGFDCILCIKIHTHKALSSSSRFNYIESEYSSVQKFKTTAVYSIYRSDLTDISDKSNEYKGKKNRYA